MSATPDKPPPLRLLRGDDDPDPAMEPGSERVATEQDHAQLVVPGSAVLLPEGHGDVVEHHPPDDDVREIEGRVLPNAPAAGSVMLRVAGRVARLPRSERARAVVGTLALHPLTVLQGGHSWWVRAWDGLTHGVYRRQIRAAEAMGDSLTLAEWVDRRRAAANERTARLMNLSAVVLSIVKVAIIALIGLPILLFLIAFLVWVTGAGDFPTVWIAVGKGLRWLFLVIGFAVPLLFIATPFLLVFALWREGRRAGLLPGWLATSADADVDITIDETTIARALEALRIPQITAYLKQGLPLQFLVTARKDGRGTYAEFRLPAGVTAEQIAKKRAALATGLYRLAKEVWPTTGSEAGIVKLWIADKGALAEGAGPYPLLTDGVVDVFKGVPLGKTLRGDPIVAPLMERNTINGGMPGQGKSSAARAKLAGAALDPSAEIWIHVPDTNFDFELFQPRAARYVMGAEDEKIEEIRDDLRDLYAEVQRRGELLVQQQEPAVTRKLADAGIGLHPLFYLLEEAHLAIQHKEFGKEIAQLLIDIVKLGRKRGIHVIVSTQAPTKDSMPRDVTRNCSNGIAFAVGDHVANDALLGQGAYSAGHRATELIPGVDKGTAVCKGLTGERSDIVQVYFISIERGRDELTPIIERSLAAIAALGRGVPGRDTPRQVEPPSRDLLDDLDQVLGDERVRLADVPGLLRKLAPDWLRYTSLNGVQLRDLLAAEGVHAPKSGNVLFLDPDTVRAVLARRDEEGGR